MLRMSLHTASRIAPWLLVSIFGASLIFLVTQLMRVTPIFAGAGLSIFEAFRILALLSVPVVGWALTPGFVVAVFAVAGDMFRSGEQDVLDAAGIPRWKVLGGPAMTAVPLAFLSAWIWIFASPSSQQHVYKTVSKLAGKALIANLKSNRFNSPAPGMTFFAEKKLAEGTFKNTLLELCENKSHTLHVIAPKMELIYHSNNMALSLKAKNGQVFSGLLNNNVAVMEFDELNLSFSLADELNTRLDFIPALMAISTSQLINENNVKGTSKNERSFTLWRRIAGPTGFIAMSIVAMTLAFLGRWQRRRTAIATAAILFTGFHLAGRFCEALMAGGTISPLVAAFAPSALVIIAGCFLPALIWVRSTVKH